MGQTIQGKIITTHDQCNHLEGAGQNFSVRTLMGLFLSVAPLKL